MTKERYAIVGGGGYVGYHIAKQLVSTLKAKVVMLDKREQAYGPIIDGMEYFHIDLSSSLELEKYFQNIKCVFHVASYGMSGKEQFNTKLIDVVNVKGCEKVIEACIKSSVPALVYTSTYNVVFCGQEIINGNESALPYIPLNQHPDHYSRTKSIAEQMILKNNGQTLANGRGVLNTCALRMAGIYGPGEERHLPRIVNFIHAGLFKVLVGPPSVRVDFVHIDNVSQAHVKAGLALVDEFGCPGKSSGQAYFISDNLPVNNFEFFRPLVEGLGYSYPRQRLPVWLVYFVAFLTELLHDIVCPIWNFQPFLTRAEVFKTGVHHTFAIDKAINDFGYKPTIQNDLREVTQWFIDRGHHRTVYEKNRKNQLWICLAISLVATILFAIAFGFFC